MSALGLINFLLKRVDDLEGAKPEVVKVLGVIARKVEAPKDEFHLALDGIFLAHGYWR